MNRPAYTQRLHTLEIPVRGLSLLLPSSAIAEVVSVAPLTPVPFAPPWLLGALGWRSLAVPVVSFEALMGARPADPAGAAKVVVFYPLPGRADWEFFGLISSAEPRPLAVDPAEAVAATSAELPESPYVAAGLKQAGRLLAIPDLEAMRQAFYP